ncbi:MAG: DUF805 domain-containing protein [Fibromonadales bacterium]|nr:DUF805 domain-containing protein [Fibromonadales bacterium]
MKKTTTLSGRACRKEFWFSWLCNTVAFIVVFMILVFLQSMFQPPESAVMIIYALVWVVFVFLNFSVSVRRLHDTNHSGLYLILGVLIPPIGPFILLIAFLLKGTPGENKYGPNPRL